jgi:LPXTG-site transpeptidase (sortase) family protein
MTTSLQASARPSLRRLAAAVLGAVVVLGTFSVAAPTSAEAYTYVYKPVSGLPGATKVDRIVVTRVSINLPIRNGVIGAPIYERIAYHYPGTSWPGGHSNTYLYAHARAGSFLNLKYMRVGDIIRLHLVTGGWVRYKVTTVRQVAWNDGRWTLLTSRERLTLQTCTSYYRTANKIVVVAVPLA